MSFEVFEGIVGVKNDEEPDPDIAKCSKCGWQGPVLKCERGMEGDWESGYHEFDLCPVCDDGGCIDDYAMSEERAKEWNEWFERNKVVTEVSPQ